MYSQSVRRTGDNLGLATGFWSGVGEWNWALNLGGSDAVSQQTSVIIELHCRTSSCSHRTLLGMRKNWAFPFAARFFDKCLDYSINLIVSKDSCHPKSKLQCLASKYETGPTFIAICIWLCQNGLVKTKVTFCCCCCCCCCWGGADIKSLFLMPVTTATTILNFCLYH